MEKQKLLKNNIDQGVAAWINYLNSNRLENMLIDLSNQGLNFKKSIYLLNESLNIINKEIIIRNRGGGFGMHGFIAEIAETGFTNARDILKGKKISTYWVDDNGPVDLIRNNIRIQQKFVNSGGLFSLNAVKSHMEKYPYYLNENGKYQIPKDHYENIRNLLEMPRSEASKLTNNSQYTFNQWRRVNDYFSKENISIDDIEASKLRYSEVQKNKINDTYSNERSRLKKENEKLEEDIKYHHRVTVKEGFRVVATSALLESSSIFISELYKKKKKAGSFAKITTDDWCEIVKTSGFGAIKGAARGGTVFIMTNFMNTPAAVATSLCTATFAVADQASLLRKEKISREEFLENSSKICLEVSVSAIYSMMGQTLIPIPILGAIIGNTIGTTLYTISNEILSFDEIELIKNYNREMQIIEDQFNHSYGKLISEYKQALESFYLILENAFNPNVEIAFEGSIHLAKSLGVDSKSILCTVEDIDDYFLN